MMESDDKALRPSTTALCTKMNNPRSLYSKFNEMPSLVFDSAGEDTGGAHGKKTMKRDEISQLRSQVLRSNRPTNPWYEAQKPFASSPPPSSSSTSSTSESDKITPMRSMKSSSATNQRGSARNRPIIPQGGVPSSPPSAVPCKPLRQPESAMEEIAEARRLAKDIQTLRELESESVQLLSRITRRVADESSPRAAAIAPDMLRCQENSTNHTEQLLLSPASSNSSTSNNSSLSGSARLCYRTGPLSTNNVGRNVRVLPEVNTNRGKVGRVCRRSQSGLANCATCGNGIEEIVLNALNRTYHPSCFRCRHCNRALDGMPFTIGRDGNAYCLEDYERLFVPACAKCSKPIAAVTGCGEIVRVVLSGGNEYHIGCYTCEGCARQLNNEGEGKCHPLGEHLLCRSCNIHWKRAGGVNRPITDL